jgi:hypothetical protein
MRPLGLKPDIILAFYAGLKARSSTVVVRVFLLWLDVLVLWADV